MDKKIESDFAQPADAPPPFTDEDTSKLLGDLPPPPQSLRPLTLPVCLPQTVSGYDAPFARAYNPELAASGIEAGDWLKFLDGLNIAINASPPLRVVNTVGMGIGFIPNHWTMVAGAVIQTAAQTAMHVLSKTLTDRYLRKANSEYFEPRGLKVRLMKTQAMRRFVHIDADDSKPPNKAKQFAVAAGHAAESVALRLPIIGRVISRIPTGTPKVDPYGPEDVTHRRLADLHGYVSPVSTDVPPPKQPEGLMDQASALSIKFRQWHANKSQAERMRQRRLLEIAQGRAASAGGPSSSSGLSGRRMRRAERRARRGGRIRMRRLEARVRKADRQEYLATGNLLWVVLMNADQDKDIKGKELADAEGDVEYVNDDDWKKELEIEAAEAAAEEDEEDEEDEEEDEDLKYKMAVQAKDHGAL